MKRFLTLIAALIAVLIVAIIALPFLVDANRFRPMLEQQLSQALGRQVTIGNLSLALLDGGVAANNLAISEDPAFGKQPFVIAKAVNIGVDLRALVFSRALHVQGVTIEGADITLIQTDGGTWNFSSLGAVAKPTTEPAANRAPGPAQANAATPLDLSN
jgi:AsmA protein